MQRAEECDGSVMRIGVMTDIGKARRTNEELSWPNRRGSPSLMAWAGTRRAMWRADWLLRRSAPSLQGAKIRRKP